MSEVSEGLCATAGVGLQVTALVSGAGCFGQGKGLYPPKPAVRGYSPANFRLDQPASRGTSGPGQVIM